MAGLPILGDIPGLPLVGRRILDRLNTPPDPTACALFALAALAINSDIIPLLRVSRLFCHSGIAPPPLSIA
jgi:hypothetical protein